MTKEKKKQGKAGIVVGFLILFLLAYALHRLFIFVDKLLF